MALTVERTDQPLPERGLEEAFYRVVAGDVQQSLSMLGQILQEEVSDEVRKAVFSASAFGDGILVSVTKVPPSLLDSVDRAMDESVDLDSALGRAVSLSEVLTEEPLDTESVRDTVSSAVQQSLMNMKDLISRAKAQAN